MNKSDSHAFVNHLLVYTLVMIGLSGSIGLATVWMRNQMAQTANRIKIAETRTMEIERRLAETGSLIASEQSPDVLRRRNVEWKLGLVQPREDQVVRVDGRPEQRLAAKRNAEIFNTTPAITPVNVLLSDAQ
jgi:hypothetical protein